MTKEMLKNFKEEKDSLDECICGSCDYYTHFFVREFGKDKQLHFDAIYCKKFNVPVAHKIIDSCLSYIAKVDDK